MSILKRRRQKELSTEGVVHFYSLLTADDKKQFLKILENTSTHSILPKTKKSIRELPNHRLVQKVLAQDALHKNSGVNYHRGGGLFDAAHSVYAAGKAVLGGLFGHVTEHENNRGLNDREAEMAILIDAAYEKKRPIRVGEWKLLPEYSTDYGCVYQNPEGEVAIAVRGTKTKFKDLAKDLGILGANVAADAEVDALFRRVAEDFPDNKKFAAGHSLGSALIKHGMKNLGESGKEFQAYLFNCGSSPFLNINEWKGFVEDYQPELMANKGDLVNSGLLEALPKGYDKIVYNPEVSVAVWKNHSLDQWLPPDAEKQFVYEEPNDVVPVRQETTEETAEKPNS